MTNLWHYVPTEALIMFFYGHCLSHLNYASTVWSATDEDYLHRLVRLHRRAIKLLCRTPNIPTDEKYKQLQILPLKDQFKYNLCTMIFKQSHQLTPPYLRDLEQQQNARIM